MQGTELTQTSKRIAMHAKQQIKQTVNSIERTVLNMNNSNEDVPQPLCYEEMSTNSTTKYVANFADVPTNFHKWSLEEQCKWLENTGVFRDKPRNIMTLFAAAYRPGDCGSSPAEKPEWLDMNKFRRGQKFATEYLFGVAYAEMLCLIIIYSLQYGARPLFFTQKSSTPYLSFKRYLSTFNHVRNWYSSDPWAEGSPAQKSILLVRAMHLSVSQKLSSLDQATIDTMSRIENPWCPAYDMLRKDFAASSPVSARSQSLYSIFDKCPTKIKEISQTGMYGTQFAFVGYAILFPETFGIHKATHEDLEAFCHLWRCIGYLLGIEDECNFCRGSLEDVQQRSWEFIEHAIKPNLYSITPEWEHMTRCVMAGINYYVPAVSYEMAVLEAADCLNINLPNVRASLTYSQWIGMYIKKFVFRCLCRFQSVRECLNTRFNASLNRACNYTPDQHAKLEKRCAATMSL